MAVDCENERKKEIENVYTSVFWPSFFLFFFFAFFFLLKNFTLVVVRVSSQKTASPFQKRNKRHFFYHKRERFKVDLNTRTKAQNTRTKHSSEQRERATRSTFWLFSKNHTQRVRIFSFTNKAFTLERRKFSDFQSFSLSAAAAQNLRTSSSCPSLKNSRRYSPISTMGRERSRLYSSSRRARTPGRDGTILSRLGG